LPPRSSLLSAKATGTTATFSWDTTEVAEGAHDLMAVAVDDLDSSTSTAPVRVQVRNSSGGAGGCASAGAAKPLIGLALALAMAATARRKRRAVHPVELPRRRWLPG